MLSKILNKYDKIFIDTSAFLVDKDNVFKSTYTENYLKDLSIDFLQKEFYIKKLYNALKVNNLNSV